MITLGKTERIRRYLVQHPAATVSEIIEALDVFGIESVDITVAKQELSEGGPPLDIGLDEILAAAAFIQQCGTATLAKHLLELAVALGEKES